MVASEPTERAAQQEMAVSVRAKAVLHAPRTWLNRRARHRSIAPGQDGG